MQVKVEISYFLHYVNKQIPVIITIHILLPLLTFKVKLQIIYHLKNYYLENTDLLVTIV